MHPVELHQVQTALSAQPRTAAEQEALVAASRLRGAADKVQRAIEVRDERAEIESIGELDALMNRLKARRARVAA